MVVYDETEYFRQFDDDQFRYPFTPRKQRLSSYQFFIPEEGDDYNYYHTSLKYGRSSACLEPHWFSQANFFSELYDAIVDFINKSVVTVVPVESEEEMRKKPYENPDEMNCGGEFFEKIKFISYQNEQQKVSLSYDLDLLADLDYAIWLDI